MLNNMQKWFIIVLSVFLLNIGKNIAKVIVWSNEIYNKKNPDTNIYKF